MKTAKTCQRFDEILDLKFLDGIEPLPEEQRFLANQQKICRRCRVRMRMIDDLALLKDLPAPTLSRGELVVVSDEILGEVRRREQAPFWDRFSPVTLAGAVALLAILLLTGVLLMASRSEVSEGPALKVASASDGAAIGDRLVTRGDSLPLGRVLTVESGKVKLRLSRKLTTVVGASSRMTFLAADEKDMRFQLSQGSATFHFSPRRKGERCAVEVPDGEIQVVGTVFRVTVRAKRTLVEVAEGKVRFVPTRGASVLVAAGLAYSADAGLFRSSSRRIPARRMPTPAGF